VSEPRLSGMLLDSRPSNPNRALQMETQHVPAFQSADGRYARIAPTRFPSGPLVHRITSYKKKALWDAVQVWLEGGAPANGAVDARESVVHAFTGKGGATWRIYADATPKEQRAPLVWTAFATPAALDTTTFGYRWNAEVLSQTDAKGGALATLPEYYRLGKDKSGQKDQWVPVPVAEVPVETGLQKVAFDRVDRERSKPYVTPEEAGGSWKKPGPAAGPFRVELGDGSVVTYSWYRFVDQPALLNAGLTDAEREALQFRVEKIHRTWTKERDYLPPPTVGKPAELDPALLVSPPAGMEAGYVPIATRQEAK